jgi:hypothetical protein
MPFARTSQDEKLPLVSFPRLCNSFDEDDIKNASSKSEFSSKLISLKIYMCNRLLCQHCH